MGPHFFSNRKIYTSHNDRDVKNKIKIKRRSKNEKKIYNGRISSNGNNRNDNDE